MEWNLGYTILLLSVFLPVTAIAESSERLHLSIKPRICVLSQGESSCEGSVAINWSSKNKTAQSVCLYKESDPKPLQCWESANKGKYSILVAAAESITFRLRNALNNDLLAEKEFEVVHDTKRYRRSRRNPWSFY